MFFPFIVPRSLLFTIVFGLFGWRFFTLISDVFETGDQTHRKSFLNRGIVSKNLFLKKQKIVKVEIFIKNLNYWVVAYKITRSKFYNQGN